MSDLQALANERALAHGLDRDLVSAIIVTESNWKPMACRFEPVWKYFYEPRHFAQTCGITVNTETILQACSFGLMQVMGSVCRELGLEGSLLQLASADVGLEYGCKKLSSLMRKYADEQKAIAAYNAGSARYLASGSFENQGYVDKVSAKLRELRKLG